MKIWFRIGPDRGSEQDGPQPPERYCSAHTTVRFLDPTRFSGARRLPAHPPAPIPLLPRKRGLKSGTNLSESGRLSDISTRFWSKSRSLRKQTIKPLLPGSRIAQCVTRLL